MGIVLKQLEKIPSYLTEEHHAKISDVSNYFNDDYEMKTVDQYIRKYGIDKGYKLFDKVYNGPEGFKAYHEKNIHSIETFLNNLSIYEKVSNKTLVFIFFGRLETALLVAMIIGLKIIIDKSTKNIEEGVNKPPLIYYILFIKALNACTAPCALSLFSIKLSQFESI